LAIWISDCAATIWMSGLAQAASAPQAAGPDQSFLARIGPDRGRQHTRNRRNRAVEAEFAEHREACERIGRKCPDCGHQAQRDRQIVVAAFLRQIGGREIDGDAARGQRQPRGDQRRTNSFPRFRHRLVGQADDGKGG
jgi:hypothetical protein